jgi:hypothetical protein
MHPCWIITALYRYENSNITGITVLHPGASGNTLPVNSWTLCRMPGTLETAQYDLPAGALLDVLNLDAAAGEQSALRVKLRNTIEKSRQLQKEWSSRFDEFYDEALRQDWDAPFIIRQVAFLLEKQRAALEHLYPVIAKLQGSIAAHRGRLDTEVLELYRVIADWAFGWITPYQTLGDKLLALAFERRFAHDTVLRARPVEGPVDHEALSREFIARFPNIRAALAK